MGGVSGWQPLLAINPYTGAPPRLRGPSPPGKDRGGRSLFMLSHKARYALRALVELTREDGGQMTAADLSVRADAPRKFLEAILLELSRRGIVRRLSARNERTVTELADPFNVTLEAVSQHIRVLERAGLVKRTRRGREYVCTFDPSPLKRAVKLIETLATFWDRRLDELDAFLAEKKP